MRSRRQMRAIRQQNQSVQSISLHSNSILHENNIIQQYADLQFSDQRAHEDSSDQGQLSSQKLKFLGVDKFPAKYAPKIKDISQTREGISQYLTGNSQGMKYQGASRNSYSIRKQKQQSMHQNEHFDIDSFLNSRPIINQKKQTKNNKIDIERRKNNSNSFEKILQQHSKVRGKKYNLFQDIQQQDKHKKLINQYEQSNRQTRDFIKRNQKNHIHLREEQRGSPGNDSITLITIPELPVIPQIPQIAHKSKYSYSKNRNKHNRGYSFSNNNNQQQLKEQITQKKLFQMRFEQAKINFMDSFLPENMKIGNNPYNFLKYTNQKNRRMFKMI